MFLNAKALIAPAAIFAMAVETAGGDPLSADNLLRYAVTQGGLFGVVLIGAYFYRRDMKSIADQRMDRIDVLTNIVAAASVAQTKTADALQESIASNRSQATSIQQLTMIIQRLEVSLTGGRRMSDITAPPA